MKVVILHQHFNSPEKGGPLRSYYLAKALAESGIQVVVITAYNGKFHTKTVVEGIEVHWLPVAYENKFGFLARSFSFLKFVWKSIRVAGEVKNVNLCYAISTPLTVGLAAIRIKQKFGIPFIFEVGDLWPDAPIQLGFVKNYFFRKWLYALEKSIYKHAESIIALSPAIQSAIEKKIPGKTVHLISNMADCNFFKPEIKNQKLKSIYSIDRELVVSYIGAFGVANGLDYFLKCAEICGKEKLAIRFILCGDGAMNDHLKQQALEMGLRNLTIVGLQNREGVKEILNVTDAVFVCYKNVPILETGSPNKFFDGLAAGKLVVVNFGGWIRAEIEEARCGIYVDPQRPLDFAEKMKSFLSQPGMLNEFQHAARLLGEAKYARESLGKKFTELLSAS